YHSISPVSLLDALPILPANSLPVNNFGNTAFFNDSFSVCVRYVVAAKWHQIQKAVVIQTFAVSSMTINRFSNSSCSLASTAKNPDLKSTHLNSSHVSIA